MVKFPEKLVMPVFGPDSDNAAGKRNAGFSGSPGNPPDMGSSDKCVPSIRNSWDQRLKITTDPNAPFFESFRRLRSLILYSRGGRPPRTILVTSAVPGEGKGFVCANLGVALSQCMEHQALMLDCDFRKPSLAGLFGLKNEIGLADHLRDNIDLSPLIRETGQPKLRLIPGGKPPNNPAELLGSARMASLIEELAGRYDDRFVLFDTPPNIIASETSVLAQHLDGVVLVIRHGWSKKDQVKQFVDAVGADRILGIVFNACPENKAETLLYGKFGNSYYGYPGYSFRS